MESFFSRYRNLVVLLVVLLLQVIGLAVQVRKPAASAGGTLSASTYGPTGAAQRRDGRGVLLIRSWSASLVTPAERLFHGTGQNIQNLWSNYADLRHVRDQNKELQQTIDRLRLEQASLLEDARQGQRLQELMKFRENYIYDTLPAQVIGTSGSTQSQILYLDKGAEDGLSPDMAVITGDGIVGKIRDVYPHTSQVLVINDQTSGAGVVLETTRIRGILRGNAAGQPQVINITADQRIQPGERVLTAGGDQVFPRGLPVGVVQKVERDPQRGDFIRVIVKPAANLQHLDEVLVITSLSPHLSPKQMADLATSEDLKGAEVAAEAQRKKAAAEMGERLPGLHDPGAPVTAPAVGPDGKPLPVPPPATPKPLPAAHPDRFSPGSGGGSTDSSGSVPVTAPETAAPAAQPKAQTVPKPTTTKPATPKAGGVQ
jgi:rod shape-determining protein MreC